MEWNDDRLLLVLHRARSLHDAGVQLGLDASTVSRRLSNLETKLGAPLFDRTRDGLRATVAAERLRPHAERMEMEAVAAAHAVRAVETGANGLVRVATTEALAEQLIAGGLLALGRQHPELVIEVLSGNRPVDLVRGDADLAVRFAALRQPSLRARCIVTTGIGLFAAPGYLGARGRVRTPAGLRGHDILLPTGDLGRLPEARWLASRPSVRVTFRSNSMPALVAAAVAAHGIVPLPLGWGDREPGLERVLVLDAIPKRKLWLVTSEAAGRRPAVRVVADEVALLLTRGSRT